MKNITLSFILIFFSVVLLAQKSGVNKIEILNHDSLYYSTNSQIIEKVNTKEKQLAYHVDYSTSKFGESVKNKNFIIQDDRLITINIVKFCLLNCDEMTNSSIPWRLEYRIFDLKDQDYRPVGVVQNLKSGFLNIPNSEEIIYTKGKIHFDFIHFEGKIILMLQAEDKLCLYENIGKLMDNEWKLLQTLPVSSSLGYFQAEVNQKGIILYATNRGQYLINHNLEKIEKISNRNRKSRVVLYDLTTQQYDLVRQSKGKRIIKKQKNKSNEK